MNQKKYYIRHLESEDHLVHLSFYEDNKKVGHTILDEEVKINVRSIADKFSQYKLHILSGDKKYLVERVARYCGLVIINMK